VLATAAIAGTDVQSALLAQWRVDAGQEFSAARGRALFERRANDWSCSSCHTADPRATGRHVVTEKSIRPLAPASNPRRFTDRTKVEKWFRRNCNDVLNRDCTALEKGDVLTYLVSLK